MMRDSLTRDHIANHCLAMFFSADPDHQYTLQVLKIVNKTFDKSPRISLIPLLCLLMCQFSRLKKRIAKKRTQKSVTAISIPITAGLADPTESDVTAVISVLFNFSKGRNL